MEKKNLMSHYCVSIVFALEQHPAQANTNERPGESNKDSHSRFYTVISWKLDPRIKSQIVIIWKVGAGVRLTCLSFPLCDTNLNYQPTTLYTAIFVHRYKTILLIQTVYQLYIKFHTWIL